LALALALAFWLSVAIAHAVGMSAGIWSSLLERDDVV
jgi:hypothetical protein